MVPSTRDPLPEDLRERAMDEAPVGITIAEIDGDVNPLIYVNDAFEHITGYSGEDMVGKNCRLLQGETTDPASISVLRQAIADGTAATVELVNYRRNGEPFWNEVTIAPIREADGEITHFVGFQNDVTARKEAETALARERETLDRLLERIGGLVSDVTRDLVEAEHREAVDHRVVERFAGTDLYEFAWIAELDSDGEYFRPRARSESLDVDAEALTVGPEEAPHPFRRATERGRVETTAWREGAPAWAPVDTAGGLVAVPLAYGERSYGVLGLVTERLADVDEREVAVLEALGRAVAVAARALESRRILTTDSYVDVTYEISDPGPFFVTLSARCGCGLTYEGSVNRDGGPVSLFFTIDAQADAVVDAAAGLPGVEQAHRVSDQLVEFQVGPDSLVVDLAGRGIKTREIVVEDGTARVALELPPEIDSRAVG